MRNLLLILVVFLIVRCTGKGTGIDAQGFGGRNEVPKITLQAFAKTFPELNSNSVLFCRSLVPNLNLGDAAAMLVNPGITETDPPTTIELHQSGESMFGSYTLNNSISEAFPIRSMPGFNGIISIIGSETSNPNGIVAVYDPYQQALPGFVLASTQVRKNTVIYERNALCLLGPAHPALKSLQEIQASLNPSLDPSILENAAPFIFPNTLPIDPSGTWKTPCTGQRITQVTFLSSSIVFREKNYTDFDCKNPLIEIEMEGAISPSSGMLNIQDTKQYDFYPSHSWVLMERDVLMVSIMNLSSWFGGGWTIGKRKDVLGLAMYPWSKTIVKKEMLLPVLVQSDGAHLKLFFPMEDSSAAEYFSGTPTFITLEQNLE